MNFYVQEHKYYCGIDLHARKMYVCVLSQEGKVLGEDVVIGWNPSSAGKGSPSFWTMPGLCGAVHDGKTRSDKIDFYKIAIQYKGGSFPVAYCDETECLNCS